MKINKITRLIVSILIGLTLLQHAHAKTWNFMVYIAANNNLHRYGLQNKRQMETIGSNKNINIFVQIDNLGKKEVFRYKIEKGKSVLLETIKKAPLSLSGTKENLFDFAKSVITKSPADYNALILWNHGSGIKDPRLWARHLPYQRDECFFLNPETNFYEIDKSFLRGIAFNDIGHTYLTNPDLKVTGEKICKELLHGKKLDLLGMDACHMAMIEVGSEIKSSAHYMVGSQEIEPGDGWDYSTVLRPFLQRCLTPAELATQITTCYGKKYNPRFADLTLSAINLGHLNSLEKNIDTVATLLLKLIKDKPKGNYFQLLKKVRTSPAMTISFLDSDYIDLGCFYQNLQKNLDPQKATGAQKEIVTQLKKTLGDGIKILQTTVIHNSTGRNVKKACGLSIYFPTRALHTSYLKSEFSKTTNWCNMINTFLKTRRDSLV